MNKSNGWKRPSWGTTMSQIPSVNMKICDASEGDEMMTNAAQPAFAATKAIRSKQSYKRIPRILCATDLSGRSDGAVQRAVMLARQTDALLLLLHVVDEKLPPDIVGGRAERARSVLEARQLTSGAEITVRVGKPYRTIARVANEWDADLVVLGAYRRRSGDQFFGTTAERVIRTTDRAVLIVNGEPTGRYRDVLLASDLSAAFAQVVSTTHQLGLLDGVRASFVHVPTDASRAMLYTPRNALTVQLDAAGLDSARFPIIHKHGAPFDAIASVVEEVSPQLLVLGATRYPLLKRLFGASVANHVLRGIRCDVLLAPAPAAAHVRDDQPMAAVSNHARNASGTGWPMHR